MTSAGMVSMLGGEMIRAGSAPVKQAMEVEDAMADIKKWWTLKSRTVFKR